VEWTAKAAMDGVFGLAVGAALIPLATRVFQPLWSLVTGSRPAGHH
jgi:hypothetical protein